MRETKYIVCYRLIRKVGKEKNKAEKWDRELNKCMWGGALQFRQPRKCHC